MASPFRCSQVYLASLELTADIEALGAAVRPAELGAQLEPIVAAWLGKTADSNARVREASEAALLGLCRAGAATVEAVGTHASAPPRRAGDVRGQLGRLSLLACLVAEYGVAAPLERCVACAKRALASPNGQVRQRAVDLCREVYRLSEGGAFGALLDELKPAQRETFAAMLNEVDAERSLGSEGGQLPPDGLSDIAEGNEDEASTRGASRGPAASGGGGRRQQQQQLASTSELEGSFSVPQPEPAGGGGEEQGGEGDEQTCQFCARHDPDFSDENLDLHFWRDCPMLMTCSLCEQVVEISYYREHLLTECESAEAHAQGERLSEGTCPLCGVVVPADEGGWTDHLLVSARPPRSLDASRCAAPPPPEVRRRLMPPAPPLPLHRAAQVDICEKNPRPVAT